MHYSGGVSGAEARSIYGLGSPHQFLPLFDGAECAGMDTEIFFYGDSGRYSAYKVRLAKSICNKCPIIEMCRDFAMGLPGIHGIWGGTTEYERQELRRIINAKAG